MSKNSTACTTFTGTCIGANVHITKLIRRAAVVANRPISASMLGV